MLYPRHTGNIFSISADVFCSEWDQGQMSCALDCNGQSALMLETRTCLAPAPDLAPIGQIAAQSAQVLVVNGFRLLQAETAHFLASAVPPSVSALPATTLPATTLPTAAPAISSRWGPGR